MTAQLDSNRFVSPPLNESKQNVLEIINHHLKYNPSHPLFQYTEHNGILHVVTWDDIGVGLQSTVQLVHNCCGPSPPSDSETYTIAILANLNSISYFCLIYGIMLAGFVPFPISLRNSADAVAHLLSTTNCRALFYSEDHRTQDIYTSSILILGECGIDLPTFIAPTFSSLMESKDSLHTVDISHMVKSERPCIIYHSSGSSGHPKPIYLSHEIIFKWGVVMAYRDSDINPCSEIISIHGLPFYHVMAFCSVLSCIVAGSVASVFAPGQELVPPSPELVLQAAIATHSNKMFTFPAFLEVWSKNPNHVEKLKEFKSIAFSGGPTSREVGETLSLAGVPLSSMYGSTETGPVSVFFRSSLHSAGWDWLKAHPGLAIDFKPVEDGLYKLIIKENVLKKLTVANTVVEKVPAYDTADIVIRHPSDPMLWKVVGREDTLIVHSTGEKTNPIPIEEIIQLDDRIAAAVVFGREQVRTGVLILPVPAFTVDTEDPTAMSNYREAIWHVIQSANEKAPSHSRIFKEMIIIASSRRPFEFTEKGFPKRHAVMQEYREEIDSLYNVDTQHAMGADGRDKVLGDGSDLNTVKCFIRSVVSSAMSRTIGDDENVFTFGADSLCATSIRNVILRAIPPVTKDPQSGPVLPRDLVFLYPTINSLSSFLFSLPIWSLVKKKPSLLSVEDLIADPTFKVPDMVTRPGGVTAVSAIVKFRDIDGEIPLVLVPGIEGSSGTFNTLQELYKHAVWAFDLTQEPADKFDSVHSMASFYYDELKRELPVGPYRFASYSGSSVVMLCLIKLLEDSGDQVIQAAYMDHFPSVYLNIYLSGVSDLSSFNPNTSPTDLDRYLRKNFILMRKLFSFMHTNGNEREVALVLFSQIVEATINNEPVRFPVMENTINRMKQIVSITIKFLFGDGFRTDGEWSWDRYTTWLTSTKVVPTVYLCDNGICRVYDDHEKALTSGLGAKDIMSTARVVVVEGDHYDMVFNQTVADDLHNGFV